MTNRDKKDSIRDRMADTGQPFNVARRKAEAAAAGQRSPHRRGPDQLIEVEVGTDARPPTPQTGTFPGRPPSPRRIETFRGRWVIEPDPERVYPRPVPHGSNRSVYYGVAQTRRGRIAVYRGKGYPPITAEQIEKDPCSGRGTRRL